MTYYLVNTSGNQITIELSKDLILSLYKNPVKIEELNEEQISKIKNNYPSVRIFTFSDVSTKYWDRKEYRRFRTFFKKKAWRRELVDTNKTMVEIEPFKSSELSSEFNTEGNN
jgi:hypothetical protein